MKPQAEIPSGVILHDLVTYCDERGSLTEVFRAMWAEDEEFVQWNFVESGINTLRGVHVHPVHSDFLVVLQGCLMLGLHDLRKWSPTFRVSCLVELRGNQMQGVFIPPGVAHGFYFPEQTRFIYGVSDYWNPSDELGCLWSDPQISIPWPATNPILSQRDREAGSLQKLMDLLDTQHATSPMMADSGIGR